MPFLFLSDRDQELLAGFAKLRSFPLAFIYLVIVFMGRLWPRLSSPLDLKMVLVVYNGICVIAGAISCTLLLCGWYEAGSFYTRIENDYIKQGCFVYFASKCFELLDTLFMILRHKGKQISFLHVYHHCTILLLGDYCYTFMPWPSTSFVFALNSFVHVFMYAYYCQSTLMKEERPQWKKAVTQLQILQFVVGIIHGVNGYLYHNFCLYSVLYGCSMLFLFSRFYCKAYWNKGNKADTKRKAS